MLAAGYTSNCKRNHCGCESTVNAQCSLEAGFVLQVAGDLDIKVRYMHIMQQGSVV